MKIYEAMATAMLEIEAIAKARNNAQQGYKFRGIDDVYNMIHGVLAKNKIFTVPELLELSTEERQTKSGSTLIFRLVKVKYKFYSEDGSVFEAIVPGEGQDSGDKATNKAMSAAHKYALLQVFAIPTEDIEDADRESQEIGNPFDKIMNYFDLMEKAETVEALQKQFTAAYKAAKDDMQKKALIDCKDKCKAKLTKKPEQVEAKDEAALF